MALIDHVNLKALLKEYSDNGTEFEPGDLEREVNSALVILGARQRSLLKSRVKLIEDLTHASRNMRVLLKGSRRVDEPTHAWYVVTAKSVIRGWSDALYAPAVAPADDAFTLRVTRVASRTSGRTFPIENLLKLMPKRLGPTQGMCKYFAISTLDPMMGEIRAIFHEKLKKGEVLYNTRDIVENLALFGKNAHVNMCSYEEGLLIWNSYAYTWFRSCARER
jgi:hypothetical protein